MDDRRRPPSAGNCLLARRLVERGVRFVQLYHGSGSKWDAHSGIEGNHSDAVPRDAIKPVAGLLQGSESAAGCSTKRWSSGAASSAARR